LLMEEDVKWAEATVSVQSFFRDRFVPP